MTTDGWTESAAAWIAEQGDAGDFGRRHVLDAPMLDRIRRLHPRTALDVGCGEGRFCRMMQAAGVHTVGIDPTPALLDRARQLDPGGDYRIGRAETLEDGAFDLVVSYLTLIDIPDLATALARMCAVVRPGGTLLIANLTSFNTAAMPDGWKNDRFCIDHYMDERPVWIEWRGIRIQNWHRPLSTHMRLLLDLGLQLRHFDEPMPTSEDAAKLALYRRAPFFHIMEWQKPAAPP
jgi:SAM-dependent methyltransferase